MKTCCLILAGSFLLAATAFAAKEWPQFRGPNASGVSERARPPVHFGPGSNELWRLKIPSGLSSPCLSGDSIFLTAFQEGKLEVLAVDRRTGKLRWERVVPAKEIEKYHLEEGSPASGTCATDGKLVVSYFGSCGLVAHDFAGHEKWRLELPTATQAGDFGSGTSPIIADGTVLLNRDQAKGSELLAVELSSGRIKWRAARRELGSSYGTPVVWKNSRTTEVVLPGFTQMRAYDLESGLETWRVRGLPSASCTTPVMGDGLLFFAGWAPGKDMAMPTYDKILEADKDGDGVLAKSEASAMMQSFFASFDTDKDDKLTRAEWEGFLNMLAKGENSLIAIKPGGKGDVTESHVAWKQMKGLPYVPSPLFYRGHVYLIKDGGLLSRYNARTGAPSYEQERIGALGNYYTSPVAADGRIYVASVNGVLTVLDAGEKPVVLGRTEFKERIGATPALVDKTIYIRSADHLWAFAK